MPLIYAGSVLTASDAAAGDLYGWSVAISGDGLVMAVGAPGWEGAYGTNIGGVYIYDLTGGSWVKRSAIVPGIGDSSAVGVALNHDGTILAVGISNHSTALGQNGGVMIYEWVYGSVWDWRGYAVLKAADGALYDNFGCAVALDATGNILAVGASGWEGANSNQGGVYLFDWSGSAWTQRGSVITASDAAAGDAFGAGVALDSAGEILVVGAPNWENTATENYGCAYTFDWSGSAWTQRSGVAVASDLAAEERFGTSVALSADGETLAAGAVWKVRPSGASGGAYLLTWSGTAWVEQEIIEADDHALDDAFGTGIAMSGDATILAIGAPYWEGAATDQGGVYLYAVTPGTLADITTPITVRVGELGNIATGLTINVRKVADITTPLTIHVTTVADITTPLMINVYDTAIFSDVAVKNNNGKTWRARVVLAGVDVSAQLTGSVFVDAESDASRIAKFSIGLSVPFNPTQWQDATVTVDYIIDSTYWRLMTGNVSHVQVDIANALLLFTAADARNRMLANALPAQIDAITPDAYHSALLFGETQTSADYLKQRQASQTGSLDMSPYNVLRLNSWMESAPLKTFTEADIYDGTLGVSVAPSTDGGTGTSTTGKKIKITIEVRMQRLRRATMSFGWGAGGITGKSARFLPGPDLVTEALNNLTEGWKPAKTVITSSAPSWDGAARVSSSMSGTIERRWLQDVSRKFIYTVRDAAVAADAPSTQEINLSVETKYDAYAWEQNGETVPTTAPVADQVADVNAGIAAALNAAQKQIAGDRRSNKITFNVPLDPTLDLPYTYAVNTAYLVAAGRSEQVSHEMNIITGEATTTMTLAMFGSPSSGATSGAGGLGSIVPTVKLENESVPDLVMSPPAMNTQIVFRPPFPGAPLDWTAPGWAIEIHEITSVIKTKATGSDTVMTSTGDYQVKVTGYKISGVSTRYDVVKSQFRIDVPAIQASETDAVTSEHQQDFVVNLPVSAFDLTI